MRSRLQESDSFTALVNRLECSSGRTGEVYPPTVVVRAKQVVVTFLVEPLSGRGDQTCQGNDEVPYTVELDEPLGDRELVDGACDAGTAEATSYCGVEGAVRWPS